MNKKVSLQFSRVCTDTVYIFRGKRQHSSLSSLSKSVSHFKNWLRNLCTNSSRRRRRCRSTPCVRVCYTNEAHAAAHTTIAQKAQTHTRQMCMLVCTTNKYRVIVSQIERHGTTDETTRHEHTLKFNILIIAKSMDVRAFSASGCAEWCCVLLLCTKRRCWCVCFSIKIGDHVRQNGTQTHKQFPYVRFDGAQMLVAANQYRKQKQQRQFCHPQWFADDGWVLVCYSASSMV